MAILFALIFTFMFILFAFVVDIAHLINTKMNLQIAADEAAYAGAAMQARALNRIGQMNYRLRQDLKEFAMRVQVTHLRHNRNFPRGKAFIDGGDQAQNTEPFICQQAHGYKAISGLRYANDTNLCRNASPSTGGLPPIIVPPVIAAFDPFAQAIAAQIRKISEAADQECKAAANDNRILAEHLIATYTARSQFHVKKMKEMEQWMNEGGNADSPIRTVAFRSAMNNLALANTSTEFEVLKPRGDKPYIQLTPQPMRASLFFINFNVVGSGCVGRPSFIDFEDFVPLVTKEQSIITYYAVRLKSKPVLFFMPQAWGNSFPELVATSAAKPFGSRIGPSVSADQLVPLQNRPGNNSRLINFSFRPGDQLGIMNTKVMALLDSFHPLNAASRPDGNQNTGWPDVGKGGGLETALRIIRAPTIFDALMYPIFPDQDRTDDYLEPNIAAASYPENGEAAGREKVPVEVVGAAASGGAYSGYASASEGSYKVGLPSDIAPLENNPKAFGWADKELIHSSWGPNNGRRRVGYSVKFIGMDALMRTLRVKQNDTGQRGPISNPPEDDNFGSLRATYH